MALEYQRNIERYQFLKWGAVALRQFQGGAAGHRHLPPGQSRIYLRAASGARRSDRRRRRASGDRLSGHARRHRQPHHHGQRPRRARLGRGRDRGGGGDARPAGLDDHPRGGRLPPHRRAQGGDHRHRSGAHRHPDAARQGRGRPLRRIFRPGRLGALGRRPRDHRQHGARIWRDLRLLPGRRQDARLYAPHRPARGRHRAHRGLLPRRRACGSSEGADDPVFTETLRLDMSTVEPSASPARSGRRTRSC